MGGQLHTLTPLPLEKTWYNLYRKLGGSEGWSAWHGKSCCHWKLIPTVSLARCGPLYNWQLQYVGNILIK